MDRIRIPTSLPFPTKSLPVGVTLSYIFDYLIIIALAIVYSILDVVVTPFHQHFSLRNYTIQYPYAVHERIPIHTALTISAAFPILVIAVYTLVIDGLFSHRRKDSGWKNVYKIKDRLWEFNCGVLGLLLSQGAAFVITGTLKNLCGKPRPDLIDRCQPVPGSADPPVYGLSNYTICTQTSKAILTDGFRSFPSGHSSSSFAGLFFLSLYLAGKLHVLDQRGEVWRTFIVLVPTLAASCIAMSRIMDARHHPFDVLFGSALGILVAWAAYRQYFPPVSNSVAKGRAYPIRTWGRHMRVPEDKQADVALEPFRQPGGMAAAAPTSDVEHPPLGARSGNVFRDQIARSQRQRRQNGDQAEFQPPPGRTRSYARQRADGYESASSSGEEAADFEMQPRYELTDPEGRIGVPVVTNRPSSEHVDYEEYRSQGSGLR